MAFTIKRAFLGSALLFLYVVGITWSGMAGSSAAGSSDPQGCASYTSHALREVARVYDGDTVRLGNGEKVRLIGLNTPEIGRDGKPSEPFSEAAKARLMALLARHGRRLALRYGVQRKDRYGRSLASAYLPDGRSVAEILLREGLAVQITVPPNVGDYRCHRAAESQARGERIGIWSADLYYRGLDAGALSKRDTGFHIVRGRVSAVRRHRKNIFLDLENNLTLRVAAHDFKYFDADFFRRLRGANIVVRGWIHQYKNELQMNLRHPVAVASAALRE